jgi:polar amino acid transport system permease protein
MVVGAVYLLLSFVVRHVLNWLGATFVFGRR